jgi:hypothetical protein
MALVGLYEKIALLMSEAGYGQDSRILILGKGKKFFSISQRSSRL